MFRTTKALWKSFDNLFKLNLKNAVDQHVFSEYFSEDQNINKEKSPEIPVHFDAQKHPATLNICL